MTKRKRKSRSYKGLYLFYEEQHNLMKRLWDESRAKIYELEKENGTLIQSILRANPIKNICADVAREPNQFDLFRAYVVFNMPEYGEVELIGYGQNPEQAIKNMVFDNIKK